MAGQSCASLGLWHTNPDIVAHELTPLPSAARLGLGTANSPGCPAAASATAGAAVQLPAVTFSASLGNPCGTASSRSHALPWQLSEGTQGVLLPLSQEWLLARGLVHFPAEQAQLWGTFLQGW